MEKCRRMKRPQFKSKNWICSWHWKSSRKRLLSYRSESFATNTDTLMSGSTVKNHISLKTVFGYSATQRISFRSWFLVCQGVLPQAFPLQHPWHLQGRKLIILRLPQAGLPHQPWHLQLCQAKVWQERGPVWDRFLPSICVKWTCWKARKGRPVAQANQKNPKPNKNDRPRSRTGRPESFRHTGTAARIQRKSCGW